MKLLNIKKWGFGFIMCLFSLPLWAREKGFDEVIDGYFGDWTGWFVQAIFAAIPITEDIEILWVLIPLILGALFFTVYFKFVNIRGFSTAINIIRGKYDKMEGGDVEASESVFTVDGDNPDTFRIEGHHGEVSHFQALTAALSATVGLGNIAGVAVAISVGGPGATFWMIVAGLIGMSSKFVECTLGVKYREIGKDGVVYGGPMYYLKKGLQSKGLGKLGLVLSVLFAIMCIGGSFGGGNMFQANQAYKMFEEVTKSRIVAADISELKESHIHIEDYNYLGNMYVNRYGNSYVVDSTQKKKFEGKELYFLHVHHSSNPELQFKVMPQKKDTSKGNKEVVAFLSEDKKQESTLSLPMDFLKAKYIELYGDLFVVQNTSPVTVKNLEGDSFEVQNSVLTKSSRKNNVYGFGWLFGVFVSILVGIVILGGIKSIAKVTDKIVPFMVLVYVLASIFVLIVKAEFIGQAFSAIIEGAFSPVGIAGGALGVLVQGFKRAAFSNEAGIGSASIAHSAVKTKHPASEGLVALMEPFIDTVIVCTMTALVLIISNMDGSLMTYGKEVSQGVSITSAAFEKSISWFPYVLATAVILFAFSSMISWSYYGLQSWTYLFGKTKRAEISYKVLFCFFVVVGSASSLGAVLNFSDAMIFAMMVPNMIGLVILVPQVRDELKRYMGMIKNLKK